MLTLVLANNYVMLYLGWEGVGLASYLLISFYFNRPAAATAGKKAFIMNRVGDAGMALAIFLMFASFGTVSFSGVFSGVGKRVAAVRCSRSRCSSCSARAASRVSSRCRHGCRTRWKARPRSPP